MLYENIGHIPFKEKYENGVTRFRFEGVRWRLIEDFPRYYISEYGDIVSMVSGEAKLMKPWRSTSKKYKYVSLGTGTGTMVKLTVHSLVAKAFCKNTNGGTIVRHYDDNPENNYYKNLKWGTQADNVRDSIRNNTDFKKGVYCYENDIDYRSGAAAAEDLNLSKATICLLCKQKISHANGYHVCYAEDKQNRLSNIDDWLAEKNTYKPVIAVNKETGEKLYFKSRKEAGKILGISDCGISSVIHGRISQTHGWMFYDEAEDLDE